MDNDKLKKLAALKSSSPEEYADELKSGLYKDEKPFNYEDPYGVEEELSSVREMVRKAIKAMAKPETRSQEELEAEAELDADPERKALEARIRLNKMLLDEDLL